MFSSVIGSPACANLSRSGRLITLVLDDKYPISTSYNRLPVVGHFQLPGVSV